MSVHRSIIFFISAVSWITGACAEVRPGKGMELCPGDFAEFSTVNYSADGKVTTKPSSIMVAIGPQGDFEQVGILSVIGDKVIGSQAVLYDLGKKRVDKGELVAKGTEALQIHGQSYECSWQKRRSGKVTTTFWRCPELPFEHLAKMIVETAEGERQIVELVYFGPPDEETEESQKFQARLSHLLKQLPDSKE